MNIIFLEAVQNFGGARKSTIEIAARLNNSGHNVRLVDFWGTCEPFLNKANESGLKLTVLRKRKNPLILKSGNIFKTLKNIFSFILDMVYFRSKLVSIIDEFNTELVIINNTKVLIALKKKSPSFQIGFFARGWFVYENRYRLDELLIKKKVDLFMAVSQATRHAIFIRNFASLDKIHVIPNALDSSDAEKYKNDFWHNATKDRPFQLLHCGGFLPTKGQDIVLDVASKLNAMDVNFKLKLVGQVYVGSKSAKYFDSIKKRIVDENLSNRVEIIVDPPNLRLIFAKSDILLHPSLTEGLPRVVMEAMAFGVPVVGNPVGGMTDYIYHGYTGFLTEYNSVEDYIFYIKKLIENKSLYLFMSNNARDLINNCYTPDKQMIAFDRMIKNISNGNV